MVFSCDLSILIPARNEMFISNTVADIVKNMRGDTEVLVALDGEWANPPIEQHDRVSVLFLGESIGQRAATNRLAEIASGTYFMKVDAHCAFDEGFDVKLLQDCRKDRTLVPVMKNLHAFDWVCKDCDWAEYQGPTPEDSKCPECGSENIYRDILWRPREKSRTSKCGTPNSTSYRVNRELEFKYFQEYKRKQKGDLVETMSLQGSCFVVHRDKYFGLNLCDESWGSWGGQGAEVALKTWLSGGEVICTKKTWYAHLFRTQGKDFGFPYPNPANQQKNAKNKLREIFLNDSWEHAVRPLSWLVEKFAPVPDWHGVDDSEIDYESETQTTTNVVFAFDDVDEDQVVSWTRIRPEPSISKGILYYTDNRLDDKYAVPVQKQLRKVRIPIVAAYADSNGWENQPFPDANVVFSVDKEPGYMTMFEQILEGLYKFREMNIDIIYFAEHDVLYHPSHFDFTPDRSDIFYYNENVWKVHSQFGFGLHYKCRQTSGLCAYRDLLTDHYEKRIEYIKKNASNFHSREYRSLIRRIGFEPGTHGRIPELKAKSKAWESEYPNIDIRHNENLTPSRWWKHQFRHQRYTKGWTASDTIPGWGKTLLRFDEFLDEI